ncbi:MAG: DNA-binding response regulator [Clostridiales bacterium 43-6]|nr:MAG: DNA-binding response regulator [Clostridiales bacterium 43-6]
MAELIYIVDDEPSIRRLISVALKDEGYMTEEYSDGSSLLAAIRYRKPDGIILDWMMPPPDGIEVCKRLRQDYETRPIPILMLTARGDETDKILGLEMGADDFISKPFSVKELIARVHALLRRKDYLTAKTPEILKFGGLKVDLASRRVTTDGRFVELTLKEFDLLTTLMNNRGRVLTREQLLDKVWGIGYYGDARTVDVHIRYLRQKIESDADKPVYIQTLRGVGYRFAIEDEMK